MHTELVVATNHSPPFQVVNSDGRITGVVVEAISLAARRAGITLTWVHTEDSAFQVLNDRERGVDLWPLVSVSDRPKGNVHTTQPIGRAEYLIAVLSDENHPVSKAELKEYKPRRVAVTAGSWIRERLAQDFPDAKPVIVGSGHQLRALCDGQADALIADAAALYAMALHPEPSCLGKQVVERMLVGWHWDLAIASTPQRSAEADRIRAEFGYLARTGALQEVFADYPIQSQYRSQDTFSETHSERETRLFRMLLVALCISCLALLGLVLETRRRAAQALRLVEMKSSFVDRISHELRTPLNGVLGLASLLGTTPLSPVQKDYLRLILQSGEELLKLVNETLALSRLEARKESQATGPVDLRRITEDVVAILAPMARARNLELLWTVDRTIPRLVKCDGSAIRQLLINLAGNAIKYTRSGTVRISFTCMGIETGHPFVRCQVDDSGPGIPKQDRTRVFDSFVRLERASDQEVVGTGLGLAIARELVALLCGKIGVDDSEFGGASFWFEFPAQITTSTMIRGGDRVRVRVLTPSESNQSIADLSLGRELSQAGTRNSIAGKTASDTSGLLEAGEEASDGMADRMQLDTLGASSTVAESRDVTDGLAAANITAANTYRWVTLKHVHVVRISQSDSLSALASHLEAEDDSGGEWVAGFGRIDPANEYTHGEPQLQGTTAGTPVEARPAKLQFAPSSGPDPMSPDPLAPDADGVPAFAQTDDPWRRALELIAECVADAGAEITSSDTLEIAVRRAGASDQADLIVLACSAPPRSLPNVISRLRLAHRGASLPVLVVVAETGTAIPCSGTLPLGVRVLRAPFQRSQLGETISALQDESGHFESVRPNDSTSQPTAVPCEQIACASREGVQVGTDASADAMRSSRDSLPQSPRPSIPGIDTLAVSNKGPRVLLADDNPINRLVLSSMLRSLGYDCDEVADGEEALALCQRNTYQYVFLDHQMPHLDGLQTTCLLRAERDWRGSVPIISSSAADVDVYKESYIAAGVDAVLPKPYTIQELRLALSASTEHSLRMPIAQSPTDSR